MKATKLIRDKGLQYAKEIVDSAPDNATEWNEGYEFQCGQSVEISPADREKYFVDLVELKRLVESLKIINDLGGVEKLTPAFITTDKHVGYTHVRMVGNGRLSFLDDFCDFIPDGYKSDRLKQAIKDHESIYGGGESHAN
ncbi:hypothetical protein [Acinetobacter baumannii]|uniref:hypothetical protein n=1 Tax=Acinetobacter baumannii TaxID=470 RepID=UPI002FE6C50F